ncbi:MAG: hypothetical protein LBS70_09805 [Candidatus Accumulibacter sp.]|jgi:hypothetical protein|nr:hypothetical protein [Accumulibacter sp.]
MANVTENPVWENGVYQIETSDPVLGGAGGIANVQAQQLANRTQYLKARADQVDDAKGDHESLGARLDIIAAAADSAGASSQDAIVTSIKYALDQGALANLGVRALREFNQQEGVLTIRNRGVVSGCTVTKSATAARNLSISNGICFAQGRKFSVADGVNAASVPSNTGGGAVTVYAYLYQDAQGLWRLAVTPIGQAVPEGGITIYALSVPAGSTDATDPNLTQVTLIDVRRIEALFPIALANPAQVTAPITMLPDADYHVTFDMLSATGKADAMSLAMASRASNGFTVRLDAAADDVTARWRLSRLNA